MKKQLCLTMSLVLMCLAVAVGHEMYGVRDSGARRTPYAFARTHRDLADPVPRIEWGHFKHGQLWEDYCNERRLKQQCRGGPQRRLRYQDSGQRCTPAATGWTPACAPRRTQPRGWHQPTGRQQCSSWFSLFYDLFHKQQPEPRGGRSSHSKAVLPTGRAPASPDGDTRTLLPAPAENTLTDEAHKSAGEAAEDSHRDWPSDSPAEDTGRLELVIPDLEEPDAPDLDDPAPQVPRNLLPGMEPTDSSSSVHERDRPTRVAERLSHFIKL